MTSVIPLPSEETLIARARTGDWEALESLYRSYATPVHHLAWRLCRSPEDAEDVLQETFIEVARSIGGYRGEGPLLGWIKRIAASKALMRLRKERRGLLEALPEGDDWAPTVDTAAPAVRIDAERALAQLSATARVVVWLHDVEGYTHEQIGACMGKSASFSKSQLARAHVKMREALVGDPPQ
jgi:RNA polymerase sigma-70 factor (ECF subfamily)